MPQWPPTPVVPNVSTNCPMATFVPFSTWPLKVNVPLPNGVEVTVPLDTKGVPVVVTRLVQRKLVLWVCIHLSILLTQQHQLTY